MKCVLLIFMLIIFFCVPLCAGFGDEVEEFFSDIGNGFTRLFTPAGKAAKKVAIAPHALKQDTKETRKLFENLAKCFIADDAVASAELAAIKNGEPTVHNCCIVAFTQEVFAGVSGEGSPGLAFSYAGQSVVDATHGALKALHSSLQVSKIEPCSWRDVPASFVVCFRRALDMKRVAKLYGALRCVQAVEIFEASTTSE